MRVRVTGLLFLALSACGGTGSSPDGGRRFLSIGTAPPGGAFFVVGGALAEVLSQEDSAGWQVSSESTKGTQENIRRLARKELDLALANASITYFAARGEGTWKQPYPVRTVMTLAPNVALFIAPASAGFEGLGDLRGRRVVLGPAGAGFEFFVGPILEAHGLGYDDLTVLNATQTGAVDLLSDGAAAAAFLGGAVPTASIIQASTSQDIQFVPFDPAAREKLIAEYPFFEAATIPAGTYRNQNEDFEGLNVGSMHLITNAETDPDLIYQITRTLYENRDQIAARHPAGRFINESNVARDTGTDFHPGAIRYYREIGIWLGN